MTTKRAERLRPTASTCLPLRNGGEPSTMTAVAPARWRRTRRVGQRVGGHNGRARALEENPVRARRRRAPTGQARKLRRERMMQDDQPPARVYPVSWLIFISCALHCAHVLVEECADAFPPNTSGLLQDQRRNVYRQTLGTWQQRQQPRRDVAMQLSTRFERDQGGKTLTHSAGVPEEITPISVTVTSQRILQRASLPGGGKDTKVPLIWSCMLCPGVRTTLPVHVASVENAPTEQLPPCGLLQVPILN